MNPFRWEDVEKLCLGQMFMHPWELDLYTFRELLYKLQGFGDLKKEKVFHTRTLAYCSVKPHLKNQNMTPEQFWPLEKKDSSQITMDDALALRQKYIDAGLLSPVKRN